MICLKGMPPSHADLDKSHSCFFLTLGISPSASAQPESLDALLNEEASVGGPDSQVDAAPAQAEAIAAGEETDLSGAFAQASCPDNAPEPSKAKTSAILRNVLGLRRLALPTWAPLIP